MKKKFISVWIVICIIFTLVMDSDQLPATASSKDSTEQTVRTNFQQDSGHILVSSMRKATGTTKWIDIVKLPAYAKKFYQVLEESTDNDGKKDYLIMDKYFKPGKAQSSLPQKSKLYQITHTQTETSMLVARFKGNKADTIIKNIRTAFDLFALDHPEVFWLCSDSGLRFATITSSSQGKSVSYIRMDLKRFGADSFDMRENGSYTQKTILSIISKVEKRIKQIEADMPNGDVYEKVRYFNNWITKHNDQNSIEGTETPERSWKSISALLGSTGIKGPFCSGYAGAFKVLCDRANIPCITVPKADLSAYDAWNFVQIGKLWYAVDVRLNDPVVIDKNGNRQTKADSGYEREDYLLTGMDEKDSYGNVFKEIHSIAELKYALPTEMTLSKKRYAGNQQIKQLDIENYVNGFYKMLEESTNNDGVNDYLINDEYFMAGNEETNVEDLELYQVVHTADKAWMLVANVPGDQASIQAAHRRLAKVYDEFMIDHPEVFWLCGWSDVKFIDVIANGKISYIFLVLKSYGKDSFDMRGDYTEESIQADIAKLEQSVKDILNDMPNGSVAEKVRYFNTWLTKHNNYCTNLNGGVPIFSSKSISALFGSTGPKGPVCTGYTGAFKVLCDRVEIPCLFAVGQIGDVYHAWNYVQIDQLWYAVDVTFNDPIIVDNNGNHLVKADSGYEKEEYLLVGSETRNSKGKSFVESHEMQNTQLKDYVSSFAPYAEWSKNAYDL